MRVRIEIQSHEIQEKIQMCETETGFSEFDDGVVFGVHLVMVASHSHLHLQKEELCNF